MNYCTKCQSIYNQPGTCNCYAPARTAPYITYPATPYIYPTTAPPFYPYLTPFWSIWNPTTTSTGWTTDPTISEHIDMAPRDVASGELASWGQSMMGGDTSQMRTDC